MIEFLKKLSEYLPHPLARAISGLPMPLRLGGSYLDFSAQIKLSNDSMRTTQLVQLNRLITDACKYVDFYRDSFKTNGIDVAGLQDLRGLQVFPIIGKRELQKTKLELRSNSMHALKKSNTGGTTGQPLEFYIEKSAYAREWAHMHAIWATLGYRYTDEKLTIRGKNIGNRFFKYNFNQNEFLINAYAPLEDHIDACRKLITRRNIKWIHGYPSSIYSFLLELESVDPVLFELLIDKVQGVFLGSEYPAPQYRNYIEQHCGLKSISWYGHSEMCVLAPEREPGSGVYYPFHSYGYAEAVKDGDSYRLVATSTYNFASPFIRYDTGDLIEPTFKDGLLECFRIKEGRSSDSVIDKNGRSISLTGLIFGRHHHAFGHCEHVQVRQPAPGKIEILVTSQEARENWAELFDFSNAFFDVTFTQIDSPVRTPLGKVQLLLR